MKRALSYNRNHNLNQVLERAALISTLNAQLIKHLDQECQKHVQVANYEHGILVLIVDSPAWGTRLRYETPNLLSVFRSKEGLYNLSNIKVLVRPPAGISETEVPVKRPQCLPEHAQDLEDLAQNMQEDPLSHALKRLGQSIRQQHQSKK